MRVATVVLSCVNQLIIVKHLDRAVSLVVYNDELEPNVVYPLHDKLTVVVI